MCNNQFHPAIAISFFIKILLVIFIVSCHPESSVRFSNPQPTGGKDLPNFPEDMQGYYINTNESNVLTISDKYIFSRYEQDFKEHKDSIGKYFSLKNDSIIDKETNEKYKVELKGDSVFWHYISKQDTVFALNNNNILRKMKGYYFLNTLVDSAAWDVKKISISNEKLIIGIIGDSSEIEKLKNITENSGDTATNIFKPTRRQFKKFIRKGGFNYESIYYRMKN